MCISVMSIRYVSCLVTLCLSYILSLRLTLCALTMCALARHVTSPDSHHITHHITYHSIIPSTSCPLSPGHKPFLLTLPPGQVFVSFLILLPLSHYSSYSSSVPVCVSFIVAISFCRFFMSSPNILVSMFFRDILVLLLSYPMSYLLDNSLLNSFFR